MPGWAALPLWHWKGSFLLSFLGISGLFHILHGLLSAMGCPMQLLGGRRGQHPTFFQPGGLPVENHKMPKGVFQEDSSAAKPAERHSLELHVYTSLSKIQAEKSPADGPADGPTWGVLGRGAMEPPRTLSTRPPLPSALCPARHRKFRLKSFHILLFFRTSHSISVVVPMLVTMSCPVPTSPSPGSCLVALGAPPRAISSSSPGTCCGWRCQKDTRLCRS